MGIEGVENLMPEGESTPDEINEVTMSPEPEGDPCPTGPTTSPDVVITNDPGPAPEGDSPPDDDTHVDSEPTDPPSDSPVETVDPLADGA